MKKYEKVDAFFTSLSQLGLFGQADVPEGHPPESGDAGCPPRSVDKGPEVARSLGDWVRKATKQRCELCSSSPTYHKYIFMHIYIYIHVHILELVAAQPTELTELPELPKGSTSLHRSVRYVFFQSLNAHGARDRPRSSYGSKPMPTHLLSSQSPRLRQ